MLKDMWQEFRLRLACVLTAYREAMSYKGRPGETPREIAREQVGLFLEAVEREYQQSVVASKKHGYYHKEF